MWEPAGYLIRVRMGTRVVGRIEESITMSVHWACQSNLRRSLGSQVCIRRVVSSARSKELRWSQRKGVKRGKRFRPRALGTLGILNIHKRRRLSKAPSIEIRNAKSQKLAKIHFPAADA